MISEDEVYAPEWVAVYTKDGEFIRFKRVPE